MLQEATMAERQLAPIVDEIERQLPKTGALVSVVGLCGAGKTTVVDSLMARGFQTFAPISDVLITGPTDTITAEGVEAAASLQVRREYNRRRPATLILDDMPVTGKQLNELWDLVDLYGDELIVVHLEAALTTRLRRIGAGKSAAARSSLFLTLREEERAPQTLYKQMAKYVPWYIRVATD